MSPPLVAIVGRPNVGKSTLFNALARRRISIVEPTSGVTRDRVSAILTDDDGAQIELVDTGGMGLGTHDAFAGDIEHQIRYAVERAAALVLLVDAADGLVPRDREIARRLRTLDKPLVLVANKVESAATAATAAEFHRLGLGEPIPVSALQRISTGDLRQRLFRLAGERGDAAPPEMNVAIVGRRNVGKSAFINALANEERMIVSEVAGTTRDAVDVRFELDGHTFVAIDTAGLRKRRRVADAIEFYSHVRAEESVRRADVVLFLFDAQSEVARVDKQLARYICEHYQPCIIVINKWDLAKHLEKTDYVKYFGAELPGLRVAPICFVSALKNRHVKSTIELARSLWKQANTRVSTAQLNTVIEGLKRRPQRGGRVSRRPRIYYGTQVATAPPTLVLFVNQPDRFSPSTRRFVENFLRERLPFPEVPIQVRYKKATARPAAQAPPPPRRRGRRGHPPRGHPAP